LTDIQTTSSTALRLTEAYE